MENCIAEIVSEIEFARLLSDAQQHEANSTSAQALSLTESLATKTSGWPTSCETYSKISDPTRTCA